MDQTNNQPQPQEEAPEQFEFELTDEQLEAVAGGADPRELIAGINRHKLDADLTLPKGPTEIGIGQTANLNSNK